METDEAVYRRGVDMSTTPGCYYDDDIYISVATTTCFLVSKMASRTCSECRSLEAASRDVTAAADAEAAAC